MIQFNLLPAVKLEYLKAERSRRLVISIAVIVSLVSLAVLVLLVIGVDGLQKKHLRDLNNDIKKYSTQLQNTKDLNKILTVQNQLGSLTDLHNAKPAATRLFTYLTQTTPVQVSISSISIDFGQHTVSVSGNADALSTVNQYVDTLKFTTYSDGTKRAGSQPTAFSDVVLRSFDSSDPASYTIVFSYDPVIFDITKNVSLSVPQIVTTRSAVEQPTDLFKVP